MAATTGMVSVSKLGLFLLKPYHGRSFRNQAHFSASAPESFYIKRLCRQAGQQEFTSCGRRTDAYLQNSAFYRNLLTEYFPALIVHREGDTV